MPWAIRWIGYLMPLTYFTMISRGEFLRGTPLDAPAMWVPILVLAVMAAVIFSLAIIRFRRDLAPRRSSHVSAPAEA